MHVAIIMDGNGRWAKQRGLRRDAGHREGARAVRRTVEAALCSGIDVLTLYAFSSDNWTRPAAEVFSLLRLFKQYLQSETALCQEQGVRINVIGRRDRLHIGLVDTILRAERATGDGTKLTLQIAVDYSAREAIMRAASSNSDSVVPLCGQEPALLSRAGSTQVQDNPVTLQGFSQQIARATHSRINESAVDLLIRTGGEQRLSDFLLWECAYAELVFIDTYWPDFDESSLVAALQEFQRRERRFGGMVDDTVAHAAGESG